MDGLGKHQALVKHYLHEHPSEDWEEFIKQAAQAEWLDKRFFENMAKLLGASD